MAQHDMILDDQAGLAFLADLNAALAALVGNSSGATEPATMTAYMWWADTSSGWLKQRNAANNAWINKLKLADATSTVGAALISAADAAAARSAIGAIGPGDDVVLAAGKNIVFEGTTDDANETILSTGDPTADRAIVLPDMSGTVAVQARGADIASAGTINLTTATGDIVDVTGTTSITAITLADGLERQVRFTGALTLTNGASLVLPSGANITTAAGDIAVFRGYSAGVVRCVGYQKASGQAVVSSAGITLGTPVASTSGTSIDFTSLPAGTKRITVMFDAVSTNGSSVPQIQIGDSGGVETSGYVAYGQTTALTSGFPFNNTTNQVAATQIFGQAILTLMDSSTNTWAYSVAIGINAGGAAPFYAGGTKSLSATLDSVRITTVNGTDTFDAGKINISYE